MSVVLQQEALSVSQISQTQTWSHSPGGEGRFQNPITLSFQTISQPLRASARTGGTSQTVVHRLKEHSAFLSPLWGFMNQKEGKFIRRFFCCLLFDIFKIYPTDLRHSSSLSTSACAVYWIVFGATAIGERGFTDEINRELLKRRDTQQKHTVDKQLMHMHFPIQQNPRACAHTFTDSNKHAS